jgi:hypothetical protein
VDPATNAAAPAPATTPAATQAPAAPAPQAPAAPAPAPAPAAQPAAPAAGETVVPTIASQPQGDPNWLKDRIAQAKRSAESEAQAKLLKDLGVDNVEAAKARIAAAKAAEDASKTELQKVTERANALAAEAARATKLAEVVSARAGYELASLTEAQQQAVKDLAGDDPAMQLQTIDRLKKGGLLTAAAPSAPAAPAAPAAAAPAAPAAPPPIAAPASTAPVTQGPPPGSAAPQTDDDLRKAYQRVQTELSDPAMKIKPASDADKRNALAASITAYQLRDRLFPNLNNPR